MTHSPFSWPFPSCVLLQTSETSNNHMIIMRAIVVFHSRYIPNQLLITFDTCANKCQFVQCQNNTEQHIPDAFLRGSMKILTWDPTAFMLLKELIEFVDENPAEKKTVSSYSLTQHSLLKKPMRRALKVHLLLELIMIVKSTWNSVQEMERLLSGNRESLWPD